MTEPGAQSSSQAGAPPADIGPPRRTDRWPQPLTAGCCLCAALLLAALAYWAPWVAHRAAALQLSGQDLGEFVKFLPSIRRGELFYPRQVFYLPPFVCSLALAFLAANRELAFPRWVRLALLAASFFILPGLLPPVWGHPRDLFAAEFRLQGSAFLIGVLAIAAHGLLARLPLRALGAGLGLAAGIALALPQVAFWVVQPLIWDAYNTPTVRLGWGLWLDIAAWGAAAALSVWLFRQTDPHLTDPPQQGYNAATQKGGTPDGQQQTDS